MDSYDISNKMKDLWSLHTDKNSGAITKRYNRIPLCVWTEHGYKEVADIKFNEQLKILELILEEDL